VSISAHAPSAAVGDVRSIAAPWRARVLGVVAILIISMTALALLPIGIITAFRTRRLYSRIAAFAAIRILGLYGVHLRVVPRQLFPRAQVIYVSNHSSTLDLFILVALGLPNCRFFLSGFLRKIVPLGAIAWMMGTFFTVPQNRPDERRRIFARAERVLRRTRESVYLSPEGGRITSGEIGHFNKAAFHLATNLHVPIVPLYFEIPPAVDPGRGFDARPGEITVHIQPSIDTRGWTISQLAANVAHVRDLYVRRHQARHA
jgi:1-acyl-sn-glycerol-3-phosphate acyltransferase